MLYRDAHGTVSEFSAGWLELRARLADTPPSLRTEQQHDAHLFDGVVVPGMETGDGEWRKLPISAVGAEGGGLQLLPALAPYPA